MIEACKPGQKLEQPLNVKQNSATQLTQADTKQYYYWERYEDWERYLIVYGLVTTALFLIAAIIGAWRDSIYDRRRRRTRRKRTRSKEICPYGDVKQCPDHLRKVLAVAEVCSLVDEEDLTHRLMRYNNDQAILREVLTYKPLHNGTLATSDATNGIL